MIPGLVDQMVAQLDGRPVMHADYRIIGIETRIRSPLGQTVEELGLIPLDIVIPAVVRGRAGFGYGWGMPCTLHTSAGDIGFDIQLPI
jgi:hypothetical protein